MHFYERRKQKFVYIFLFVLARRFYRFLKNFPNVGYDILERGYRNIFLFSKKKFVSTCNVTMNEPNHFILNYISITLVKTMGLPGNVTRFLHYRNF